MQPHVVQTGLGPIPLWSEPAVLSSTKPLVLVITGAWADPADMIKTPAVVGPAWDAAVMRLPGNGAPVLRETTVEAWARAVGELLDVAFAGRPVVLVGVSIGALVALGVRSSQVRRVLALEPPLVMSKLWPLEPALRARWASDALARPMIEAVFGLTATGREERTYFHLFEDAPPVDVLVGAISLFPVRPLPRFPSFVDDPERAWLAARPGVNLRVAPDAGHNIHVLASSLLREVLLTSLDKALLTASQD